MHKNLVIAIYRISSMPGLYMQNKHDFTHAYFPRDRFDEVSERGRWMFGRKGKAYIGLYSQNGYQWQSEGKYKDAEMIAEGKKNIWLCEMGREVNNGSFSRFCESLLKAGLSFKGMNVLYDSPSRGEVRFGWSGPFWVNGKRVPLSNHLRYDNPYSQVAHDPKVIEIRREGEWLRLELDGFGRSFSSLV